MFTLYHADCLGQAANCLYPHRVEVRTQADLAAAVGSDYVCAEYRSHRRSGENFLGADCLPVDCDNDHSDRPADWITPERVAEAFPGVAFGVHFSRNHMKEKGGRSPRPRFHVLFPIAREENSEAYRTMKKQVQALFPYFDPRALDAARFFFGTAEAQVALYPGEQTLSDYFSALSQTEPTGLSPAPVIPEGSRNATLSQFAACVLKHHGDSPTARQRFREKAACCVPPLPAAELEAIWRSALGFYRKISAQPGYVPPAAYDGALAEPELTLMPSDYSDLGQATVLTREYQYRLRYSTATDYLVYNGSFWEESVPRAQGLAQELTERQLAEADEALTRSEADLKQAGLWSMVTRAGSRSTDPALPPAQAAAFRRYRSASAYRRFVLQRRNRRYISDALHEAHAMLEIDVKLLDSDAFLLNTPSATYDLRLGPDAPRAHTPTDFLTRQTAVDPSREGMALWQQTLDTFFCGDPDLIRYVQEVVGLAAIGKVFIEGIIIAYGDGRNGKSTFWNTLARVLGSYSGCISSAALTTAGVHNLKPELAELKGKRLIIASELEEDMKLSTANVKQFCSTDEIVAEKKFRAPFSFTPSHTMVLCTNHLPTVGATDTGTWRRLIILPFCAYIPPDSDVKNFADLLFEQCGGAILTWIMEGARRVIGQGYRLTMPAAVREILDRYRENNDWLLQFLETCCERGPVLQEQSGAVYSAYRSFCAMTCQTIRSTTEFYRSLERVGVRRKRVNAGNLLLGIQLKPNQPDSQFIP